MELFDKQFVYLEWDDKLKGKEVFLGDTLPQLRVSVNGNCNSLQEISKNVSDDSFYPFISPCGTRYAMAYYDSLYEYKLAYNQGKKVEVYGFVGISRAWIEVTDDWKWEENYEYRVKPESEMWTTCIDDEGIINVMPAREWNKDEGRQLIEGTNEECQRYAVENYCAKCAYQDACVHQKRMMKINMWYCQGFREPKEVKKHRMTNRELAKWLAQGNGECMGDEIAMSCWRYVYNEADIPVKDDVQIRGWDETEWHEPEVEEE